MSFGPVSRGLPSFSSRLVRLLALLLLGALLVFSALEYALQLQPLFERMAARESVWAGAGAEERLLASVRRTEQQVRALQSLAEQGLIRLDRPQEFKRLLTSQLEGTIADGVHLANSDGEELSLFNDDGRIRVFQVQPAASPGKVLWMSFQEGAAELQQAWHSDSYDARARPWFVQALAAHDRTPAWTSPFRLLSNGRAGMAVSMRWSDAAGKTWVLAVNVSLMVLSDYTRSLKIAEGGRVAMVLDDGRLLASPRHPNLQTREQVEAALLKPPSASGLELIAEAVRHQERASLETGEVFSLQDSSGTRWVASVRKIRLGGHGVSIVTLAPFSDYVPLGWHTVLLASVILAGVLLLSTLGAFRLARRISRPLLELAQESQRIGRLDLVAPLAVPHVDVEEIAIVVDAQERMRQRLLAAHGELEAANRLLEQRVEQRTLELQGSRSKLAEELALNRALVDSLPFPILQKDAEGRFLHVNKAYESFFGIEVGQIVGKRLIDCEELAGLNREAYQRSDDELLVLGAQKREERVLQLDAQRGWSMLYYASAYRRSDGSVAGMVGTYVDISDQKAAQRATEEARAAAEAATRMKSEFLANMSHEIRTPMNAIMGMAHLALRGPLPERERGYVEKIDRAANNLLGIINDILDFSKVEAGKLSMEQVPFSLSQSLDQLVSLMGARAAQKGLELLFVLDPGLPDVLVGDPLRLAQVLLNLVNNAIKFTAQGEITVDIEMLARQGKGVELQFSVKDTGIGMSAEQSAALFQPFTQADSSITRKYGGTGLGLAISRRIVELMGGRIWVESREGRGSCFSFTAHFDCQEAVAATRMPMAHELKGKRGLLLERHQSVRTNLLGMLEGFGVRVDLADTSEDVLERVIAANHEANPYAFVVVGVREDGDAAAWRAVQAAQLATPPAGVLICADPTQSEALRDCAVLTRPVTPSALLEALGRAQTGVQAGGEQLTAEARRIEPGTSGRLSGARLLLVEDNEMNRELATELLQRAGCEVVCTENGQLALDVLAQGGRFDGVLMDCQMPVMDGYTATRLLRANPEWQGLPVIAMTANASESDRQAVLAAGMNDHISKPLDIDAMFATLEAWIVPSASPRTAPAPVSALPHEASLDLSVFKVLDTQQGLRRTRGDAALYCRLLRLFARNQQNFVVDFRAAQSAADPAMQRRQAHTLKGLAGNIGAVQLQAAAAELEALCRKEASVELIEHGLSVVQERLRAVLEDIARLPSSAQSVSGAMPADAKDIRERLETLLQLTQDFDAEAMDVSRQLCLDLSGSAVAENLLQVQVLLESCDFDAASETLRATLAGFVATSDEPVQRNAGTDFPL